VAAVAVIIAAHRHVSRTVKQRVGNAKQRRRRDIGHRIVDIPNLGCALRLTNGDEIGSSITGIICRCNAKVGIEITETLRNHASSGIRIANVIIDRSRSCRIARHENQLVSSVAGKIGALKQSRACKAGTGGGKGSKRNLSESIG